MTMTWRARDSRGHYLPSKDVHTTLGPEDWDDTCRHQPAAELQPSEDDFGHEPMNVYTNGKLRVVVCARCRIVRTIWWPGGRCHVADISDVKWPCTSAIILGLVPRTEAAA
jgi:hypothetical protein